MKPTIRIIGIKRLDDWSLFEITFTHLVNGKWTNVSEQHMAIGKKQDELAVFKYLQHKYNVVN